jgi:hypothetical protein
MRQQKRGTESFISIAGGRNIETQIDNLLLSAQGLNVVNVYYIYIYFSEYLLSFLRAVLVFNL